MSFANKVVLVTGASSGIGAAVAEAFSAEGARVVLVARNETKLAAVAARCRNALVLQADVTVDDDLRLIIDRTIEILGRIDILINNAGIGITGTLTSGTIIDCYDSIMKVNLRAVVFLTSLATPFLMKTKGNIINVSSIAGMLPSEEKTGLAMYSVSKAALNHYGQCAAAELAPYGIRVNTISPGPVKTDILVNANTRATWDDFKKHTALNRVSEPQEIAELIMFIASDKAKAITGSNYISDNGFLIKCYFKDRSN